MMSTREEELERAVADLRNVIGAVVMHLTGGGSVRRGDALFRDLKRIHRHTRDFITVKISGGASRWFEKTLGQRVVALAAELERLQRHAVAVDEALEAGPVLRALSDEAVAAEYDRRQRHVISAHNLASFGEREGMLLACTDEELQEELDRRRRRSREAFIARHSASLGREPASDRLDAPAYAYAWVGDQAHIPCSQRGCTNSRRRDEMWCSQHGPIRHRTTTR